MNSDRAYSQSKLAVWIFFDVLNYIACRGWVYPGAREDGGFYFAAFHMRPEDSDSVDEWLKDAVEKYGGETKWTLIRSKLNRFFICPENLTNELPSEGKYDAKEIDEIMKTLPSWAEAAERDILLFSDYLYNQHKAEAKTRNSQKVLPPAVQ